MRNRNLFKKSAMKVIAVLTAVVMLAGLTACGQEAAAPAGSEPAGTEAAANEASAVEEATSAESPEIVDIPFDLADMMEQVAASELEPSYTAYLPDEVFANCELFGTEDGKAYVYMNVTEFVVLNDKAYEMSGRTGEAIIHYTETADGAKLDEVEWSTDGAGHDAWIEEHFPADILAAWEAYNPSDENGFSKLGMKMIVKAEEALGVEVERENLLTIDPETGNYEIVKTSESGNPEEDNYEFHYDVLEEGTLTAK